MTDYRIFSGPGAPWPPASAPPPPAASTAFAAPIVLAAGFTVTAYSWYKGPSYWRADNSAPGTAQKFALLQIVGSIVGSGIPPIVLPAGTITSGPLTAAQWNDALYGTPIQLTPNVPYMVSTGLTGNFNFVATFWQSGGGAAGLVNGPLKFYKNGGDIFSNGQELFNTGGGSDPTVTLPNTGNNGFDAGLDTIISNVAPAGALYRIFPPGLVPNGLGVNLAGTDAATISMQVNVTHAAQSVNIWHYSGPGCTALPDDCAIYNIAGPVAVVTVTGATWSGAAGSGWVKCTNLPATSLAVGSYKVATHRATTGPQWFTAISSFWTTQLGSTGVLVNGPVNAPTRAASANQGTFDNLTPGVITYPTQFNDEGYWLDLEVLPTAAAAGGGALLAAWP